MSRTINKTVELLFDLVKIKLDFNTTGVTERELSYDRWVYGNPDDTEWLAKCLIKEFIVINNELKVGLIEFDGNNYFFVTGLDNPNHLPIGVSFFPLNPGLFVAIISDLEIPVKSDISDLYIEQNILSQSKNDKGYNGHDYNDLIRIFPSISIFKIDSNYIGDYANTKSYVRQFFCLYLSCNKKYLPLDFSQNTLQEINKFSCLNSQILNYDNIIQALLSSHYKFTFLDIYRCVELLYQVVYIDEMHQKLTITNSKLDLLENIDNVLKWKPNERNTIQKIFNDTNSVYKTLLVNNIKNITSHKQNISDWIYDLRCSIVHLKPNHKHIDLSQTQWDGIIGGLVKILIFWYTRYSSF